MMKVPLLDLRAQYRGIRDEAERALRDVCDSQQFVLGPRVAELEARVAACSGARHGIGVSSGTDALLIALMALDVGPGDEVITTPFTFFATAGTIARLGARPVFCDIDPRDFNLCPSAVLSFIDQHCRSEGGRLINGTTGNTVKAVIPVHLYGQMADMDAIGAIAGRYGLRVVEDAAQAIGAALPDGRRAGAIGDVGCFSFFPTKNLGAFGDAGMCVANDDALAERIRILRVHGGHTKYHHDIVGGNFRLDELQAAVLLVKLPHLDEWSAARGRNAERYRALFAAADLGNAVELPEVLPGRRHIYNQFVIRAARRDALRAWLAEHDIGSEVYYPVPLHRQACFEYLGYRSGDFAEAERAAGEALALPIYPELEPAQLEHVVATIERFYRR
jgi:dTDP-4-amino-4,6-dideoxygalactose transaminase